MSIFLFCLGFLLGFGLKLGADFYVNWVRENEKMTARMEDALAMLKASEIMKNK